MKPRYYIILAISILAFALFGCASEPETTETETSTEEEIQTLEAVPAEVEKPEEPAEEVIEEVTPEEKPTYKFEVIRIQFLPNSALFQDYEKAMLLTYASYLQKYPEFKLMIKGHAARVGSEETSQSLSEERAQVVADFILGRTDIDESRLIVIGMGSREPLADNGTEAGRVANRRVEVSLIE